MAILINTLGGERGFGENSVSRNDDGYSSAIDITSIFEGGLNLFGTVYDSMYVNTNGNVTFNSGLYTYTPGAISAGTSPIFAPFWADVDTRAGEVTASTTVVDVDYSLNAYKTQLNNDEKYYEQLPVISTISNYDISNYNLLSSYNFQSSVVEVTNLTYTDLNSVDISSYYTFLRDAQDDIEEQLGDSNYNPDGNSTGSNLVWYDLDTDTKTVTVTWDDVGYYSYKMDKTNAFQLQFKETNDGDVDISFIYEDINWTTGEASDGINGLGGVVARAGYSAGDSEHYFELPTSGNQNSMLNLETFGNNGVVNISMNNGQANGIGLDTSDDILNGSDISNYLVGMGGNDTIYAGAGDDTLDGGEGDDTLYGESGNNIYYTGAGTNIVYGGTGTDEVIYAHNINNFDYNNINDYITLDFADLEIYDTLHNVDVLNFSDLSISTADIESLINLEHSVARLYSALLGRNPDNAGLNYWLGDVMLSDNTTQGMSSAFAGSEEYTARFGAQSDEQFINQLYNNILNRDADQPGYDYWLEDIANTGDRSGMIVSFADSEEYIANTQAAVSEYLESVVLNDFNTSYENSLLV